MFKWPTRLAYIGIFINYLLYLPDPFPRGLEIDLQVSSTSLSLTVLIYIGRLGLVSHLYRILFNYITICQGSWAGATTPYTRFGQHYIIAMLDWYSKHQLPGCECTVKKSCVPLERLNSACKSIYGHMQPYIHIFECIYNLDIYIYIYIYASKYICLYGYLCLYSSVYIYVCVYSCVLACIWSHPTSFPIDFAVSGLSTNKVQAVNDFLQQQQF